VAVAKQSGEVFRIEGFKDSLQEFNRLAKSYQVTLKTDLQADNYFGLYLRVDPENYQLEPTKFLLPLKQLAEWRFNENYEDFESAEPHFDQWWRENEPYLKRLSLRQKINATATAL
jgi:hypothetical protein